MTQEEALDILKLGHNIYLTGPPGSGKTFLLNRYIDYLKRNRKGVAITASTGIAATHMGGVTIHSWSGMGIKEKLTEKDFRKLLRKAYLKKRFRNSGVLIIDEISMLHAFQFDLLNEICQIFKNNVKPFGGMQVVCSGDFFQLPPIQKGGKAKFITESNIWNNMDTKICYLEEQHRQGKGELLVLLNHIRNNEIDEAKELLANREWAEKIYPSKLYTHNVDVDFINNSKLEKIDEEKFEYNMESEGSKNVVATLKKGCMAPERLVLKKGAKVMFVKNNFDKGYVNGTIGEVVDFNVDGLPVIEITGGEHIIARPASWAVEEDDVVKAEISQIPLRLSWAITVHKSQGMNLDAAEIDLSKSFVKGMGYVALSRLRSLAGLKLRGINEIAFMINSEVLELDQRLKQMSQEITEDLKKTRIEEKKKKQKQFLDSLPVIKSGKRDKKERKMPVSTYEETNVLVRQKLPIKEIAKRRGLSEETIISHLEDLMSHREEIDLKYLQPSKERFEKIKMAFQQTGDLKLSPVKEILNKDFSYQEIRLARLFIGENEEVYLHTKRGQGAKGTKNNEVSPRYGVGVEKLAEKKETSQLKKYRCQICGRAINHRGNCLPCNIKIKSEKVEKNKK